MKKRRERRPRRLRLPPVTKREGKPLPYIKLGYIVQKTTRYF